jgi:hypothetical protein
VRRIAIEDAPHFYDRPGETDLFAEDLRAIGRRKDGPAYVQTNLPTIDVERGHDFDVTRPVRADLPVHQSNPSAVGGGVAVKIYSLDQRTGAVADPYDGDSNLPHSENEQP